MDGSNAFILKKKINENENIEEKKGPSTLKQIVFYPQNSHYNLTRFSYPISCNILQFLDLFTIYVSHWDLP